MASCASPCEMSPSPATYSKRWPILTPLGMTLFGMSRVDAARGGRMAWQWVSVVPVCEFAMLVSAVNLIEMLRSRLGSRQANRWAEFSNGFARLESLKPFQAPRPESGLPYRVSKLHASGNQPLNFGFQTLANSFFLLIPTRSVIRGINLTRQSRHRLDWWDFQPMAVFLHKASIGTNA